ncbi:MAG: phytochrome sensor protein [Gemmatales bacterium]|nr:MAG: phytochrome sensor protein [Gemmatales bacterium]
MPVFKYIALDRRGREVQGNLEAADGQSAAATLRRQSLFVLQIENDAAGSASSAQTGSWLGHLRPVWTQDYVFFLQQLALMLRSGLTILQALEVCSQQSTKPRLSAAIDRMRDSIQAGKSLSQAMALEPRHFSRLTVKLIESAEASGELDTVLERAAADMEHKLDLKRKLLTSLAYPSVVILVAIGVAAFLVWKVIPKFAAFFQRRGVALPWTTQFLVDLSEYLTTYGLYVLGGVLAAILLFLLSYSTRRGRLVWDRLFLYLPVAGNLFTVAAMAQITQTLFVLLNSGVTLLDSLRISAQVIRNRAIAERINEAGEMILKGHDLATSLRDPVIPPLVPHLVAVGEQTGALTQVLERLSTFYDQQLQTLIRRMSGMVEPVMILVVGGMVGFVYMAFFQAVFQLATAGR